MKNNIEIYGYCDDRFLPVKEAFKQNFELGLEVGASFAVTLNGKLVVNIWGGYKDKAKLNLWDENTIVNVFSTTKIMTALCIHMLVDRGLINVDDPVAKYWPEFAQNGKRLIPIRYVLSHSAGLPGFDEKVSGSVIYDWDRITGLIASQKPWWKPGSKIGYHSMTFGYILGEIVRRVTGKTIGNFFREEVAEPLGIDFHIGVSEELDERIADMIVPEQISKIKLFLLGLLFRTAKKVFFNPDLEKINYNSREWRAAEIPASNGHGNARSIARIGAILACGGELDNKRLLSLNTIEKAIEKQNRGKDIVTFRQPASFGLGFGLLSEEFLLGPRSFFWSGAGGSKCVMDLDKKVSFAYAMNKMVLLGDDPRPVRLAEAVREVVNSL
jgi:CubicO group peptidase (beta-lactamase class C family)